MKRYNTLSSKRIFEMIKSVSDKEALIRFLDEDVSLPLPRWKMIASDTDLLVMNQNMNKHCRQTSCRTCKYRRGNNNNSAMECFINYLLEETRGDYENNNERLKND